MEDPFNKKNLGPQNPHLQNTQYIYNTFVLLEKELNVKKRELIKK